MSTFALDRSLREVLDHALGFDRRRTRRILGNRSSTIAARRACVSAQLPSTRTVSPRSASSVAGSRTAATREAHARADASIGMDRRPRRSASSSPSHGERDQRPPPRRALGCVAEGAHHGDRDVAATCPAAVEVDHGGECRAEADVLVGGGRVVQEVLVATRIRPHRHQPYRGSGCPVTRPIVGSVTFAQMDRWTFTYFPSASAIGTHATLSPWPPSIRCAPRSSSRRTSASDQECRRARVAVPVEGDDVPGHKA